MCTTCRGSSSTPTSPKGIHVCRSSHFPPRKVGTKSRQNHQAPLNSNSIQTRQTLLDILHPGKIYCPKPSQPKFVVLHYSTFIPTPHGVYHSIYLVYLTGMWFYMPLYVANHSHHSIRGCTKVRLGHGYIPVLDLPSLTNFSLQHANCTQYRSSRLEAFRQQSSAPEIHPHSNHQQQSRL